MFNGKGKYSGESYEKAAKFTAQGKLGVTTAAFLFTKAASCFKKISICSILSKFKFIQILSGAIICLSSASELYKDGACYLSAANCFYEIATLRELECDFEKACTNYELASAYYTHESAIRFVNTIINVYVLL